MKYTGDPPLGVKTNCDPLPGEKTDGDTPSGMKTFWSNWLESQYLTPPTPPPPPQISGETTSMPYLKLCHY